jgi:hypothetical protein
LRGVLCVQDVIGPEWTKVMTHWQGQQQERDEKPAQPSHERLSIRERAVSTFLRRSIHVRYCFRGFRTRPIILGGEESSGHLIAEFTTPARPTEQDEEFEEPHRIVRLMQPGRQRFPQVIDQCSSRLTHLPKTRRSQVVKTRRLYDRGSRVMSGVSARRNPMACCRSASVCPSVDSPT